MTLSVGDVLQNRYRIARLVGQGGFGAVYRAWDLLLEQPVALKENFNVGPEAQRRFEREAKLLAGLRHPNLPRVIDRFVLPGQGEYLVMDFVDGQSLGAILAERGRPLDEAEVLPWIRQVCDALIYLHSRTPPIIHRDIKPQNIIITGDGRAMLVDFGISKLFEPDRGTTIGARAVTPGYSPPEQYGVGRTDARSDIYSLGATLYTLLTGRVPPDGPDLSSGTDALVPPRQANAAVSEATSAAILAAMSPTITQRLDSAAMLQRLLSPGPPPPAAAVPPTLVGGAAFQRPTAVVPPAGDPTAQLRDAAPQAQVRPDARPPRRAVPVWAWLAGALVLVAVVAGILWAVNGRDGGQGAATVQPTADGPATAAAVGPTAIAAEPTATPTLAATATTAPTMTPTATPARPPQLGDVRAVARGDTTAEQVFVPGGSFQMGNEGGDADESPVHAVTLDGFWIDRLEVTNAQYAACVYAGACAPPSDSSSYTRPSYFGNSQFAGYPVLFVTWNDATTFCAWGGGRLPTEAEWEYAARGPESRLYPWGDVFDNTRLNFCDANCDFPNSDPNSDDGYASTSPGGAFPAGASWAGALDMAGNVWEFVSDWYAADAYASAAASNPTGPATGENHVLRGGSWFNKPFGARSVDRYNVAPDYRDFSIGFRCVGP